MRPRAQESKDSRDTQALTHDESRRFPPDVADSRGSALLESLVTSNALARSAGQLFQGKGFLMLHAHNNATDPPEGNDMIERVAKLEERVDSALPHLSTKAEYEGSRKDLHKGQSEMKSWTLATSFMLVAAVFTVGGFLLSYMSAIARNVQTAPSQQNAPSQPVPPIIIYLPSPQAGAMAQAPSSIAHGKQETPIRR